MLNAHRIAYVGAGENAHEAQKAYIFSVKGIAYGVFSCTEHEFSAASYNTPGANIYDPLYSFEQVQQLSEQCDYAIVLYHGGKEYYRYPSPNLRRVCRRFVEKGANLVVCQHSHCVGCRESYMNGEIVYGQGNFLFDAGNDDFWNSGVLIRVEDDLMLFARVIM